MRTELKTLRQEKTSIGDAPGSRSRTCAPVGRIPSMAKAGRLHNGRYLIWIEGELEDLVDEQFREDWDEARENVLKGLRKAQRREHGINIG